MSDPIELTPEQLAQVMVQYKLANKRVNRSSYTRKNGMMWRDSFQRLHDKGNAFIIRYADFPHASPRTLYGRVTDGLLWLADNDEEKDKWQRLKQSCTLVMLPDTDDSSGILVKMRDEAKRARVESGYVQVNTQSNWREEMMQWLESAPKGSIFERKGLLLGEDDIEKIRSEMDEMGIACHVNTQEIRIMK